MKKSITVQSWDSLGKEIFGEPVEPWSRRPLSSLNVGPTKWHSAAVTWRRLWFAASTEWQKNIGLAAFIANVDVGQCCIVVYFTPLCKKTWTQQQRLLKYVVTAPQATLHLNLCVSQCVSNHFCHHVNWLHENSVHSQDASLLQAPKIDIPFEYSITE